jgi:hypothetical protein
MGGNPLATLTWNCFNNGLSIETSGTTVTKTVTWSATRGPDRSCTCQSSHPITGTQSVSVIVQVLCKLLFYLLLSFYLLYNISLRNFSFKLI